QDLFATLHVGTAYNHAAVETAGAEQGRIENVRAVGRDDQDHAFVRFKAVHLNEQLVQGLFALIVSAAQAGATMAANGVDFVDEDDTGGVLFALLKQVADAAGADANEHFHEIRTGNREEWHIGLAGNRPRQQCFAGAWRPDEQHALRNTAAQLLELLRLAEEFNDFLALFFGVI